MRGKQLIFLKKHGLLPEILAVKEDLKNSMRDQISLSNYEKLKKICQDLNLETLPSNFKVIRDSRSDSYLRLPMRSEKSDKIFVYISKSTELCKKTRTYEEKAKERELGKILSYPSCCINSYLKIIKKTAHLPLPIEISKKSSQLNFYTNPILRTVTGHYLISHFPCDFSCRKSIKLAKEVLAILTDFDPEFAQEVLNYLKFPILYFHPRKIFVFKHGKVQRNKIFRYDEVIYNKKENTHHLLFSDKVKVTNENILICRDNKLLEKITKESECEGILFYFK